MRMPVEAPVLAQRAAWEGRAQWEPQARHPPIPSSEGNRAWKER